MMGGDRAERLRGLQSETQDLRAENKDLHSTNQRLREALSKAEADLAAAMKQQQHLDRRGGGLGVEEKDELLVNMLQYKLADQVSQEEEAIAHRCIARLDDGLALCLASCHGAEGAD